MSLVTDTRGLSLQPSVILFVCVLFQVWYLLLHKGAT